MNTVAFSPAERRLLLDKYYGLRKNLSAPHNKAFSMEQRQAMAKERDAVMQEYAERLPFVPLSRCPLCDAVLEYPIDLAGLDGPWWFKGELAEFPKPEGCPHFRVLLGAIDFQSRSPVETQPIPEVLPGPGAPFVVPRLFEVIPNLRAVISSWLMPPGYLTYPIAYFSPAAAHGASLHQPWGRESYQVRNEKGAYEGWWSANDNWDFDLARWIERGGVSWILPDDPQLALHSQAPCPYTGLSGVRAPQKITRGALSTLPPPTGQILQPFE